MSEWGRINISRSLSLFSSENISNQLFDPVIIKAVQAPHYVREITAEVYFLVRPIVHTNTSRKQSFISLVRPTVHTSPSRKRSFSKTRFKTEGFENRPFVFVL